MPTEFHLFSALPAELRQKIWDIAIAIRPKRRGVRVFRLFDALQEPSVRVEDVPGFDYGANLALGIPLPEEDFVGVNGESTSDISTQIYDPDLWNTCNESRLMMKKAFVPFKGYGYGSMGYCLSGSAPFYVTITKRYHDLFIIRPDSLGLAIEDVYDSFSDPNIILGIEYQEDWGSQLYTEEQGGELCRAAELIKDMGWSARTLGVFLVDYNLKLKADASSRRTRDPSLDYYAKDRRLVEVFFNEETEQEQWEYINPIPDGDYRKSSFYFAKHIWEAFEQMNMVVDEEPYTPWIGLLGWDYL
ncbi:uncharacterized protein FTJAE_3347 [Fusarium tjaetaba]|uniref:2EXR domain-containing protein n=1 Tax=Fusarium tjaetaba TaxID=1567544 RepID=A0A8H5VZQ0_9HYPO|nr:uncharacterized protein FTJAE_3347 [Fusarium tjaetaba]KAF5643547.1 hypothetical protein FTJAE_3347 [Fusarium tjaetaba]